MKCKIVQGILMLSFMFASVLQAMPQVTTATFYGIVTDPSQAVLPGASISMTHVGTAATTTKISDERGEFAFTFLPSGTYILRIELPGFKSYVSSGFELGAAQNVRRTFALEVGGVAEQVTVTSEAPLVNTVAPDQRVSYSVLEVTQLPLANRDFTGVLTTGTGVTTSSTTIRLNGVGGAGTRVTVDGTESTGFAEASGAAQFQGFGYINLVSIDAIQEVQTTKGIIAAEYGATMSGNVNVITKSGTNQWHGSVFENYTGAALNARVQTATSKPPLTFNQFGSSIGGPIVKDKVFIFGAYEGYREAGKLVVQGNVPTPRLRDAMIAAVPDYKLYADTVWPLPNLPYDPRGTVGLYLDSRHYSLDENNATAKMDTRIFGNSTLAVTYGRSRPNRSLPQLKTSLTHAGKQERVSTSFVMGGASWTSESRFGYNWASTLRQDDVVLVVDPKAPEIAPGGRRISGIEGLGLNVPSSEVFYVGGATWTGENKISKIIGKHALKFGGIYARRGSGRENFDNSAISYANEADLLANIPNQVRVNFGLNKFVSHMDDWGVFIQDDWRITPKLTLNLGIRYDDYRNFAIKPTDSRFPAGIFNFDGLKDPINFIFGPLRRDNDPVEADHLNIGPRFGFAYNPDGQSRNVVRGGFGVMFAPRNNSVFNTTAAKTVSLPFRRDFTRAEAIARGFRYPTFNDDVEKIVLAENQISMAGLFEPNLEAPYVMNMYLGVQRALSGSMVLESAFVGTRGVKFLLTRWFNQPDRVTGLRPNQDLAFSGWYYDNSQQTFYSSLQTSLRKQYSNHMSWSLNHTFSKGLSYGGGNAGAVLIGDASRDFVQEFNNIKINRAPSIGDRTHVVSGDWVYELPAGTNFSPVLRQILGGWQLSGIFRAETGDAFDVTQLSPGFSTSRPDIVDFPNMVLSDYRKTGQYLNKAAFAKVPVSPVSRIPMRPGNAGFRAVRGPGDWTVNFGTGKNFALTESVRLGFRVDMFNALNHTNLGNPISSIDDPNFGKITTTLGARRIQANARLTF